MSHYYTNHGVFDLPEIGFEDETVHLFRKKLPEDGEAGLMVVHTKLPQDRTFQESVQHRIQEQAKRFTGHMVLKAEERRVADLPAFDVAARWFEQHKSVYNRQVHLVADGGWMIFAMSSPLAERDACDEVMDHILGTFRPRA